MKYSFLLPCIWVFLIGPCVFTADFNSFPLRHEDDEDLLVQLDVFEEQRLEDEEELSCPEGVNLTSHLDVFHALFRKVCVYGFWSLVGHHYVFSELRKLRYMPVLISVTGGYWS